MYCTCFLIQFISIYLLLASLVQHRFQTLLPGTVWHALQSAMSHLLLTLCTINVFKKVLIYLVAYNNQSKISWTWPRLFGSCLSIPSSHTTRQRWEAVSIMSLICTLSLLCGRYKTLSPRQKVLHTNRKKALWVFRTTVCLLPDIFVAPNDTSLSMVLYIPQWTKCIHVQSVINRQRHFNFNFSWLPYLKKSLDYIVLCSNHLPLGGFFPSSPSQEFFQTLRSPFPEIKVCSEAYSFRPRHI